MVNVIIEDVQDDGTLHCRLMNTIQQYAKQKGRDGVYDVDPRVRKLASKFNLEELNALRGVSGAIWNGTHVCCEFFEPRSIEDAIAFAVWTIWELKHPELNELLNTLH